MRPAQHPIRLTFESEASMRKEYDRNLKAGGAFCPGVAGFEERVACVLQLVHPVTGVALDLPAEVVFVKADDPGKGIGVHIQDFGPSVQDKLRAFMQTATAAPCLSQPPANTEPDPEQPTADQDTADQSPAQRVAVAALHDRLRGMPVVAQLKLAREGGLTERVALERIYGKSVWDALLQNQRISPPEVARIARMGTATAAILETIAANGAWLASGEVRRALLTNPRLPEDGVLRALRAMPKHELNQVCNQTHYQPRVRRVAKMLSGKA
jgi:hypothetical protein